MKNLLFLLLILVFTSCDDFLDVKPTGEKIPESVTDYELFLNDYGTFQNAQFNLYNVDPYIYYNESLLNSLPNYSVNQYKWSDTHRDFDKQDRYWNNKYKSINILNIIIENIDKAPLQKSTEQDRTRIKAEAYAQRAFEYFWMVNEYGAQYSAENLDEPGVPLMLKMDMTASLKRNTIKECYDLILSDLEVAYKHIDILANFNKDASFRPGKSSIEALYSLVYLFMGDFEKSLTHSTNALNYYDFIYNYNEFEMVGDNGWSGYEYKGDRDAFFYGVNSESYTWFRGGKIFFMWPNTLYSEELESMFDKEYDIRWINWSCNEGAYGTSHAPNYTYARWGHQTCYGITNANVLLVRAESKLRTNDGPGAIADLNLLREKRYKTGFTPLVYVDDATTKTLIKEERCKELSFTGHNVLDLKRYHSYGESIPTFKRTVNGEEFTLTPGSSKYILPIAPVLGITE